MEEKKQKRVLNRSEKGEFFKGLEPLTDAQRSFVAEWYPWAMTYANREIDRRNKHKDSTPPEVILDTAVTTLIYTATRWRPDGGCSYKSYFHTGFYTNVSNAVKRYHDTKNRTVSENLASKKCSYRDEEGCPTIYDTFKSAHELEDDMVSDIYVDDLLSRLTPLQRDMVERCYIGGEVQAEVARDIGVSKQSVNQALTHASRSLRRIINGEVTEVRRGRPKKND